MSSSGALEELALDWDMVSLIFALLWICIQGQSSVELG